MTNKANILALAERIENLPDPTQFNMRTYMHECGTPSCFAGHAAAMSMGTKKIRHWSFLHRIDAANFLGLTDSQAERLFIPGIPGQSKHYTITNKQGAALLRHLAETGRVSWSKVL